VIVVTGKGLKADGGGVLRANVPRWLNEPDLRARVLAFAHARPKDGGEGALYVLLKKRRA
jgi:DNA-nicking Smr family endonuclease